MSTAVVVRYRTRPDAADENARLVEAVYAALADLAPPDFHYATYRLADDVTFVHIAHVDGAENPLTTLPEFAEFQREIASRLDEGPIAGGATTVGSYAWVG